ncbi:MAG: Rrf2 family transcriptional regulator [Planctomycetes bacterium]|nr:Rrf2 family transcriptional regulator [Planctomycetota bacterium]
MLSTTTEYALRAIVCLASSPEEPKTGQQLAKLTKVPAGYLAKVLKQLNRAGLIRSQRGLHGGSVLTRSPKKITMLDVVDAIEPIRRIEHCPLDLKSHIKLCPLHRRLDDAIALIEKAFGTTTIDELLTEKTASTPLCESAKTATVTVRGR